MHINILLYLPPSISCNAMLTHARTPAVTHPFYIADGSFLIDHDLHCLHLQLRLQLRLESLSMSIPLCTITSL
jgi:hypothetical protein